MRRTILFGILVAAIGCSGDAIAPPDTVDPGPPQFEAVGEYYLYAAADSLICGDDGCHARTVGTYDDSIIGTYTLFVGPGGLLSLYADSTYWLRFIIGLDDLWYDAHHRGEWMATGTVYDTLAFTSDPYMVDILRGVLRGATRIIPLYVDLYMDQRRAPGDRVFKLTFRREDR